LRPRVNPPPFPPIISRRPPLDVRCLKIPSLLRVCSCFRTSPNAFDTSRAAASSSALPGCKFLAEARAQQELCGHLLPCWREFGAVGVGGRSTLGDPQQYPALFLLLKLLFLFLFPLWRGLKTVRTGPLATASPHLCFAIS